MGGHDWTKGIEGIVMARTHYEKHQGTFSDKAHMLARELVYPSFFGNRPERYVIHRVGDGEENTRLDGEQAIDLTVYSKKAERLRHPLGFTFQERFRRRRYEPYSDVTITEFNEASGKPSELYKIEATYFTYGYFGEIENTFGRVIIFNVQELKRLISKNALRFTTNQNPKKQSFVCIPIAALEHYGLIHWDSKNNGTANSIK